MEQGFPNYCESNNQFEHSFSYERGNERRELVLVHVPGEPPTLVSSVFADGSSEPSESISMNLEELQIRMDFVNQLLADGLLHF